MAAAEIVRDATDSSPAEWPTVLLLHTLSDGSSHVDWMIAADRLAQEPLITFRSPCRIDRLSTGRPVRIEPIAPHRPHYLRYEGPIDGDRGVVQRLSTGRVVRWTSDERRWRMRLAWMPTDGSGEWIQQLTVTRSPSGRTAEVTSAPVGHD